MKISTIKHDILICLLLIITTITVYWQVNNHVFCLFDDNLYVVENIHAKSGITKNNIISAFSFTKAGDKYYYHPVTMISHMIDCELFGLSAGFHHLTNVFFHLLNVILLFLVFRLMTGKRWQSAFLAALFALHPFNVDTVSWIAERKNLLSVFFGFLTLLAYFFYLKKRGIFKYIIIFISMLMSLLSKPIWVTAPFVLLLLDLWPLNRIKFQKNNNNQIADSIFSTFHSLYIFIRANRHLIIEKIPLFLLSAFWVYISILSNQRLAIMVQTETIPMNLRIANALVSYIKYLWKLFWPFNFAFHYPFPTKMLPVWQIAGAIIILVLISILFFRKWKQAPWLTVGWLWYLGTLFPTIGLTQNGTWPAMADRWAYVPLIGIYIIIAWGAPKLFSKIKNNKIQLAGETTFFISILTVLSWNQCGYWADNATLCEHALSVTTDNDVAHINLGSVYFAKENLALKREEQTQKKYTSNIDDTFSLYLRNSESQIIFRNKEDREINMQKAISHMNEAMRIAPKDPKPYFNLAKFYFTHNDMSKTIDYLLKAIEKDNGFFDAYHGLGVVMNKQNKPDKAIACYSKAIQYFPEFSDAYLNIAIILQQQGKIKECIYNYKKALEINPDHVTAHFNLGGLLLEQNKIAKAISHFSEALRIKPGFPEAHNMMGKAQKLSSNFKEAIYHYKEAVRLKPDFAAPHNNLGIVLNEIGQTDQAKYHYQKALQIDTNFAEAHNNLSGLLYRINDTAAAITHLKAANRIEPENKIYRQNLNRVLQKLDNAIQNLEAKMKKEPNNPTLQLLMGNLHLYKDDIDQAITFYKKALESNPGYFQTLPINIQKMIPPIDFQK